HLPAAAPRAASTLELVVEREAERAVVHADLFASRYALKGGDSICAVVASIRLARMMDEMHGVAHALRVERAGDLLRLFIVGKAQESGADRRGELLQLRGRHVREALPLRLVGPIVLAEQRRARGDCVAREYAASRHRFAQLIERRGIAR